MLYVHIYLFYFFVVFVLSFLANKALCGYYETRIGNGAFGFRIAYAIRFAIGSTVLPFFGVFGPVVRPL